MKTLFLVAAVVSLAVGSSSMDAHAEEQTDAAGAPAVKAYRTLNFGDDSNTVKKKMVDLFPEDGKPLHGVATKDEHLRSAETFWRALFDSDAEYAPYRFQQRTIEQPEPLGSLMKYFGAYGGQRSPGPVQVETVVGRSDAMTMYCYVLNGKDEPLEKEGLAVVTVEYRNFDSDKLIESFLQNHANGTRQSSYSKIPNVRFPGIGFEYETVRCQAVSPEKKAELVTTTGKFRFTFVALTKLSKDDQAVWSNFADASGTGQSAGEYYGAIKKAELGIQKQVEANGPQLELAAFDSLGWGHGVPAILYDGGSADASFVSKEILGYHMAKYRQSIEAETQNSKEKSKKNADNAVGF